MAKKEAEEKQNNKLAQIAAQRLMTEMDNIFKVDKIEAQYHPLTVGEQVFSGKILKRDGSVLAISDINTPGRYTLVDLNKARKNEVLNSDIKEEELVKVKRGDDQVIEITAFINEKDHNEIQSR